jgi:hypothetical protein
MLITLNKFNTDLQHFAICVYQQTCPPLSYSPWSLMQCVIAHLCSHVVSKLVKSNVTKDTHVRHLGGIHPMKEHPEQGPIHINLQRSGNNLIFLITTKS